MCGVGLDSEVQLQDHFLSKTWSLPIIDLVTHSIVLAAHSEHVSI
jgi:hypothetical protein